MSHTESLRIGMIDGSIEANSRRFHVVLDADVVVQLDDLVAVAQVLPSGEEVVHYGIVVETTRHIEGARFASDTIHIGEETMPGETARRIEVQVLRTDPEMWLSPDPGMVVRQARGADRDMALFADQMQKPLAVGMDQSQQPVHVDFEFVDGTRGAHVNISGISGVATKTSYALFLLYMLLETSDGQRLLGAHAANTRGIIFNVKGEDLLFLDRPNSKLTDEHKLDWAALGVDNPGGFTDVKLYSPRAAAATGNVVPDVRGRDRSSVTAYGWDPWTFVRMGLLRFLFTADDDRRTQVGFVEQQVRLQLARHAFPLEKSSTGTVVLVDSASDEIPYDFERIIAATRDPVAANAGTVIRDFGDILSFLELKLISQEDPTWTANTQPSTVQAFMRRLFAMRRRVGHLISTGVETVDLDTARLSVVDISRLHQSAQRFVVGALLDAVWDSKQGTGREPLRLVVLDELNKYAPREGYSPLKELLVDIAERGRALGVILIGAQQAATAIAPAIIRNAAVKVVGRLDALEAGEYRFLTPELRERATRFLPGTMVVDQPLVPAPIPIRFPFPGFATNPDEGRLTAPEAGQLEDELIDRIVKR